MQAPQHTYESLLREEILWLQYELIQERCSPLINLAKLVAHNEQELCVVPHLLSFSSLRDRQILKLRHQGEHKAHGILRCHLLCFWLFLEQLENVAVGRLLMER